MSSDQLNKAGESAKESLAMIQIKGEVSVEETRFPLKGLEIELIRGERGRLPRNLNEENITAADISGTNGEFTLELEDSDENRIRKYFVLVFPPQSPRGERILLSRSAVNVGRDHEISVSISIPASAAAEANLAVSQEDLKARSARLDAELLHRHEEARLELELASSKRPDEIHDRVRIQHIESARERARRSLQSFKPIRRSVFRERSSFEVGEKEVAKQYREKRINAFVRNLKKEKKPRLLHVPVASIENIDFSNWGGAEISSRRFASLVSSAMPPSGVLRRAATVFKCQNKAAQDETNDDSNGGDEGLAPHAPGANALHSVIRTVLEEKLLDLRSQPIVGTRQNTESLGKTIGGVDIATGPADVTAFHDYDRLRLLREPVIAYTSNTSFHPLIISIIAIWNAMRFEVGLIPKEADITDLDALEELLSDLVEEEPLVKEIETTTSVLGLEVKSTQTFEVPAPPRKSAHIARLRKLVGQLQEYLDSPYEFSLVSPDDVNFGLLSTYRQEWEPITYQVGDLVGTVPLAPGETRKVTVRTVEKKKRSELELENSMEAQKTANDVKTSSHSEVARRAQQKMNFGFKTGAGGSGFFGQGKWSVSTSLQRDSAMDSQMKKKDIREATRKAAAEYRSDVKTEIKSEEEFESTETQETSISNPNNEIPVTYLFYELQRRYEVYERLHSVIPVLLVPLEVPSPNQITDAWILRHDWIIRRVLLDDQFRAPLEFLRDGLTGDLANLGVLVAELRSKKQALDAVQNDLETTEAEIKIRQSLLTSTLVKKSLRRYLKEPIKYVKVFNSGGVPWSSNYYIPVKGEMDPKTESLFSDDLETYPFDSLDDKELWDARLDAASKSLEFSEDELADMRARHAAHMSSFNSAQEAYSAALIAYYTKSTQILQLRLHIRDNILHYMQAIWEYEPPDQRWLRLREVRVPQYRYKTAGASLTLQKNDPQIDNVATVSLGLKSGELVTVGLKGKKVVLKPSDAATPAVFGGQFVETAERDWVNLSDVANIDEPIGYHGNCIMLRLEILDDFTETMLNEYRCDVHGICDPDPEGDWTPDELEELAACIRMENADDQPAKDLADGLDEIAAERRLTRKGPETIVLPSEHLFIEALPGKHAVLEDFKLQHRGIDVQKAKVELRQGEIDALRRAGRIVEKDYEDPDADQRIVIDGRPGLNLNLNAPAPDDDN
ncbi:MAG: hypothetical protein AB2651_18595 [Candidatus Thiodiazotropha sp.]